MANKERVRLNLDLTPNVVDNLERMVELSHSASRTEVIRKSLRLFDMVLLNQVEGGKILLQRGDGTQETIQIL